MCVSNYVWLCVSQSTCGRWRKPRRSQFSSFTTWVLEIKHRFQGLLGSKHLYPMSHPPQRKCRNVAILSVMIDLYCQFDCIWNSVKPKRLATPVRVFLSFILCIWVQCCCLKTHRNDCDKRQTCEDSRLEKTTTRQSVWDALCRKITPCCLHSDYAVNTSPESQRAQCQEQTPGQTLGWGWYCVSVGPSAGVCGS